MRYSAAVVMMVLALAGGLMAQTHTKKEASATTHGSPAAVKPAAERVGSAQASTADTQKTGREGNATAKARVQHTTSAVAVTGTKAGKETMKTAHAGRRSMHKHIAHAQEAGLKETKSEKSSQPAK